MRSLLHLQILLIDEIDTFLRKRDSSQNEVTVRIKMEFAQALNNQLKNHGSLVVGKQAISITFLKVVLPSIRNIFLIYRLCPKTSLETHICNNYLLLIEVFTYLNWVSYNYSSAGPPP